MKISILSLFPELYETWINHSIISNAIKNNQVTIEIINFRLYTNDKHKKVDDYQYGGGAGMVLMIEPIVSAIRAIRTPNSYVILTTPKGQVFNQELANEFVSKYDHIIIIAGHYEGFDERINYYVDAQYSIGDFVLTGGELPSMVISDAVIRLLDGVISSSSLESESFNNYLLDYPVYTRPVVFEGHQVPDVLLSGHHKNIADFRKQQQEMITKKNRPDLYQKYLNSKK
ncbi:tRNA (guanosine(37)-N1)-methyltransferase TrmD [Ureaplasma urealyticum]|uniref:tRNA (guanine-N(1)-)-methyltransferase n=3 Tax=Ureaplasma urealyticum TaxID=2130 RepID=TRMD_UREU1|nr:tRNA (guanosine(37)-N1)-methyltransferase TrmD [Ureaplasma urealyticum]B5ZC78.1 RecName: Full=tRNA (guanine-N(1)-)-methyltransferase; AltName: Full=M1G-methyltransferase; AltName: Full=tRNA [GM37] methyltransferase [Ureaplasma urealyticum serovar 10 str. ATCC 33699]EDX53585.1 tRNA (guanine-N1)-methyltransferase [Ureaplasma urealyticum serovar 9 str. ATCC 33175]RCT49075.1 tRNA (guanosine(37)-N1)-methyltransferase TrmD [Ureaplasma parvum]ACI60363.1 tRNA (guanine-N1)-methyltransferase [Ureaplas